MTDHHYSKQSKVFTIHHSDQSHTEYYNDHGTWRKMPGMKSVDSLTQQLIESLIKYEATRRETQKTV